MQAESIVLSELMGEVMMEMGRTVEDVRNVPLRMDYTWDGLLGGVKYAQVFEKCNPVGIM